MKIILGVLLCLGFVGISIGQTPRSSDNIPPGKIGVIVYAPASTEVSKKQTAYPVFLDGVKIAQTRSGRYFIAVVTPGTHSFQMGELSMRKIELEIKTDQSYHLRVNDSPEDKDSKDFEIIKRDKAGAEMKDFKMIDNADVEDPQTAINWQEG